MMEFVYSKKNYYKLSFVHWGIRNSNSFSSFCSSCVNYFSTIFGSHSWSETMFVSSLSIRWLKCSFAHSNVFLIPALRFLISKRTAKIIHFYNLQRFFIFFFSNSCYKTAPQNLQCIASTSCPSNEHDGQDWVETCLDLSCLAISAETIPVGTAITAYPVIIIKDAIACPKGVAGAISP